MPLTPKNRCEQWLQGLVDHETTLTPKNRKEEWMKEIIDAQGGGGGGGTLIVTEVGEFPPSLSETWQSIYDAMADGKIVIISSADEYAAIHNLITEATISEGDYLIYTNFSSDPPAYIATSANGYPALNI